MDGRGEGMNVPRNIVAASLDADRLCAISATAGPGSVKVRAWVSAQIPAGIEARDPPAVAEWVRGTLDGAGVTGSRLVLAVPRGEVVLKRLKLPRGERGEADLASMVRLQMIRQLNFAIEGAAIDYTPLDEAGAGPAPSMVDVLAGALPGERMAFLRGVASGADLRVERVGLRSAGAAALLAQASRLREGSVLGVAAGWASIEFVVIERGRLVFARAADFGLASAGGGAGGGEESLAQRVAVEAKRTWMSYRVGHDSASVDTVAVLGEGPLARELAAACGAGLELPATCVSVPETLHLPERMPEADRLVALPLLGLLGERLLVPATLDFAHPRRAIDMGARRRQLALAGAAVLVAVAGLGIVMGSRDLDRLRSSARLAGQRRSNLETDYREFLLTDARLRHIEEWRGADPDWLAHLSWLSNAMPDPRRAQLDVLTGRLAASVAFTTRDGTYSGGEWSMQRESTFGLQGHAAARDVANELRARLVASNVYVVDSRGPDTPDRFDYMLATPAASPYESALAKEGP